MTSINKFDVACMVDGSRIFHYSFIKPNQPSILFFFPPYTTTSPTMLANMQAFFPLADPKIHNTLPAT